jgi:adenylate kinase family enzyme
MPAGLVSDEIVVGIIRDRIAEDDCQRRVSSWTVSRAPWPRLKRSTEMLS